MGETDNIDDASNTSAGGWNEEEAILRTCLVVLACGASATPCCQVSRRRITVSGKGGDGGGGDGGGRDADVAQGVIERYVRQAEATGHGVRSGEWTPDVVEHPNVAVLLASGGGGGGEGGAKTDGGGGGDGECKEGGTDTSSADGVGGASTGAEPASTPEQSDRSRPVSTVKLLSSSPSEAKRGAGVRGGGGRAGSSSKKKKNRRGQNSTSLLLCMCVCVVICGI